MPSDDFPWGEVNPEGGYRVGDAVGLFYSDHERYIFDNPTGVVTSVECDEDDDLQLITVQVEALVTAGDLYLIKRVTP
jgi:hypothetical protein